MINVTTIATTAIASSDVAAAAAAAVAAAAASMTATTADHDGGMTLTTTLASILVNKAIGRSRNAGAGTAFMDIDKDLKISPVTLSSDWPRVARLLLLSSLAVIGSVGNVFMISAVMVEDHLKKRGNAFLVNVALADLLVTGLVLPASAIVILAGHKETPGICKFEWTLEALCFLVTALTLATIAVENYARMCLPAEKYAALTTNRVTSITLAVWIIAGIAVALQSSFDLGPDFCGRRFNGIALEQAIGACFLVILPALITIIFYTMLMCRVRRKIKSTLKPLATFAWDYELTKTNMYSFILFAIFWSPFGTAICISTFRPVSARVFYNLAWFALSKSCINNLLYCIVDRHFRNAYVKLFNYCCCKATVTFHRRTRGDGTRSSGDVRLRVHIVHSYASPSACRPNVARVNGRDVYEL